jgi:hypothetical protein
VLRYISIDLFLVDRSFSDSKGRGFILCQCPVSLFPYYSFHFCSLDILVEAPFFNSVFVLLWPMIASAMGLDKRK